MTAKASELFVVFQNKAHHYQNLQTIRSKVQTHLSTSVNNTIDVISKQKYDRDFPKNKRYEVQTQNKGMAGRIGSISHRDRKQILMDGSYARYNHFERDFRTKNHYKNEQDRLIQQQNQKIKQKINRMRSGSTKYWQTQYKNQQKFAKKLYQNQDRTSRSSLMIDKKPFLAQPYLQFINHLHNDQKNMLDESKASQKTNKLGDVIRVDKQSIFVLPQFVSRQSRLKKSKVSQQKLDNRQNQVKDKDAQILAPQP